MARGADTTSWTRPFLDIGEEKLLQPEWLLGLQGIEAGHDLTDEIEGPDLPDEINDKPSALLGFPLVLIDLRPERPGPVFLEPDLEPEVREDLIDRKDFSDKLQAVLSRLLWVSASLRLDTSTDGGQLNVEVCPLGVP